MLMLATWSFGMRASERAWESLRAGGCALDAVEATCVAAEDDPTIDSVGYGGLPDRDGEVTLDGCVMLSPRRCGSVCGMRHNRHPVSVARLVMERTPHIMLVGHGADEFAAANGFAREVLVAPEARAAWEAWKGAPASVDQSRDCAAPPRPIDRGGPNGNPD